MSRITHTVSRTAEFFSEKELEMQMGAGRQYWLPMLFKELIDNALDACEGDRVPVPRVLVAVEEHGFVVHDNGPGIEPGTVEKSLDYLSRTSSNNLYATPTRGQLGNALKCLYAAGFVRDGRGEVTITARGVRHQITVNFNPIANKPVPDHKMTRVPDEGGTLVKVAWQNAAFDALVGHSSVPRLIGQYRLFNPHVQFWIRMPGDEEFTIVGSGRSGLSKWRPSDPQPALWMGFPRFRRLLCADISSQPEMLVRDFLRRFQGMTSTAHQKAILDAMGLQRTTIAAAFAPGGELIEDRIELLYALIGDLSQPVKAARLGVLGKDIGLDGEPDVSPESLAYKKVVIEDAHRPFVAEAWFISDAEAGGHRRLICGLNYSPVRDFSAFVLHEALEENEAESDDPITVVLHLVCPVFEFTDHGKSRVQLSDEQEEAITKALASVLATWRKHKRKLRRDQQVSQRELNRMHQPAKKVSIKAAVTQVMKDAYIHASGNGTLPANARQIMYAARGAVQRLTGGRLWSRSSYFTQTLLPDFLAEHPDLTADWDVVYDARGTFTEPHSGHAVPLGTLAVRRYVDSWRPPSVGALEPAVPLNVFTGGPAGRYRSALFVEKEGFNELFAAAGTRELYDVAIFSSKGMSTTAARQLVDRLSAEGVTVFLLHDFDASGMTIAGTIHSDGRRYIFEGRPNVIDLGLRLQQVQEMGLESEEFTFKQDADPRENLRSQGATKEECNFLVRGRRGKSWWGERVELNAMSSPQFIEFVHSQLEAHGVEKLVPDEEVLAAAYWQVRRRDALMKEIERRLAESQLADSGDGDRQILATPDDLSERVRDLLDGTKLNWISAVQQIAREDDAA